MNIDKIGNAYLCEAVLSGVQYKDSNINAPWDLNYRMRRELTKKYAWAIPTPEAIAVIQKYLPIIEIGAGKGYWASLIGGDVLCFDCHAKNPEVNNHVDGGEPYYKVRRGGADRVEDHPERTLFLCWPPYDTEMAGDCLRAYTGTHLIFIGEGNGGCTGGACFWKQIEEEWESLEDVQLPQWHGIHDWLTIYVRKD